MDWVSNVSEDDWLKVLEKKKPTTNNKMLFVVLKSEIKKNTDLLHFFFLLNYKNYIVGEVMKHLLHGFLRNSQTVVPR